MDTDKGYLTVRIQNLIFLLWNWHKLFSHIIKEKKWVWCKADVHCFNGHKLDALTWIFCMVAAVFMRDVLYVSHVTAGPQNPTEQHSNGECKRQELEAPSNHTTSASHLDLNFPLPGEKGPSCLVKVHCRSSITALWADFGTCCMMFLRVDGGVAFAGVRGLGKLQSEWRPGSLRHPLRQSSSQRSGRWEVRTGESLNS